MTMSLRFKRDMSHLLIEIARWAEANGVNPLDAFDYMVSIRSMASFSQDYALAEKMLTMLHRDPLLLPRGDAESWVGHAFCGTEHRDALHCRTEYNKHLNAVEEMKRYHHKADWASFPKVDEMWTPGDAELGSDITDALASLGLVEKGETYGDTMRRIIREWVKFKANEQKAEPAVSSPLPAPPKKPRRRKA